MLLPTHECDILIMHLIVNVVFRMHLLIKGVSIVESIVYNLCFHLRSGDNPERDLCSETFFSRMGNLVLLPKLSIISCVSDIRGKILLFVVVVTETCGIGKRKIK